MSGLTVTLLVAGLVAVTGGALSVLASRVMHAALALVLALLGVAAMIVALGATFLGFTVVLVYVGAIVVLLLVALMVTRSPIGADTDHAPGRGRVGAAVLVGVVTTVAVFVALQPHGRSTETSQVSTTQIATSIFGAWAWPFELLSLLLLVALIAGVTLARPSDEGEAQ